MVLHTTLGSSREYRTYDDRILDLSDKLTVTSLELNHILAEMQKTVQERQTIIQQLEHDITEASNGCVHRAKRHQTGEKKRPSEFGAKWCFFRTRHSGKHNHWKLKCCFACCSKAFSASLTRSVTTLTPSPGPVGTAIVLVAASSTNGGSVMSGR